MSNLFPIHKTSVYQKEQSRRAANNQRYGSPKLKDLLREKCRIRVREARQACFDQSRNFERFDAEHLAIGIIREELDEVDQDIELQEAIYKELLNNIDEWLVEQLEEEDSYLIDFAENNDLICPVCQKEGMQLTGIFECKCGTNFFYVGGKEQLRLALQEKVDAHEQNCLHTLSFFIEPQVTGYNMLNGMCQACDYFCSF